MKRIDCAVLAGSLLCSPTIAAAAPRLLTAATEGEAGTPPGGEATPGGVQPTLGAGVLELVGLTGGAKHLALYVTVALNLNIPLDADWMIIPSAGIEVSPDTGAWGGTLFLVLDRFLAKVGVVTLALEPELALIHDAVPVVAGGFEHSLYLAGGIGVALVTPHGIWVPQVIASWGVRDHSVALAPVLMFNVPF